MLRKIIKIDEEKCNGCGACASACHEGAIDMIDGKAKLMREHYCDGLGDCLPACPTGAISFEEREAPAYDEAAVLAAKKAKEQPAFAGCPGSRMKMLKQRENAACESTSCDGAINTVGAGSATADDSSFSVKSQLSQWPVQIKLLPVNAPFYDGADLLIAADCTAFAYGNFHNDFIKGRVTLIGCPKLDAVDYFEKLYQIIANNNIRSVTVVRMEVPCCGGIENAVKRAIEASGKFLPSQVIVISVSGEILSR